MTLLNINPHLTRPNSDLSHQVAITHSGMAHFAGTGPAGKDCRECAHWRPIAGAYEYFSKSGLKGGRIKPQECQKHRSLMNGRPGKPVPDDARACRHFEQSEKAPERFVK